MKAHTLKNIFMLYGLSAAKILFPLLTLPYLTRVLSLECYGVVAYVKSVMQYMQIFVDFGFMLSGTRAIVSAAQDKTDVGAIAGNILTARLILSCVALICLVPLVLYIPLLRAYAVYTILSFVSVAVSVFLFDYLFRGLEQMHIITTRYILMRGMATLLTYLIVHGDEDLIWIPVLDILGTLLAVVCIKLHIQKLGIKIRVGSWNGAMERLKDSAAYFLSNMATTVFGALNTVLIGILLSASDVAYWSLSLQLIGGVQLFYQPINDGIYPEMIRTRDLRVIWKTLGMVMPLVLLGCLFCYVAAEPLMVLVGGVDYAGATGVFRALIPVLLLSFPAMLCGWPMLGSIGKQRTVMITTILAAGIQLLGLVLLWVTGCFQLKMLAGLRCLSECVLLSARVGYGYRFRNKFQSKRCVCDGK